MYRALGLLRDPFAPAWDPDLFWESPERSAARRRALDLLREGRGVWLEGTPGSGREALLGALAFDLAREGRPVLRICGRAAQSAEDLLGSLLRAVAEPILGNEPVALAEELYAVLVEVFARWGTLTLCLPGAELPGRDALAELEILEGLRLAGEPCAALALAGQGKPPLPRLNPVRVPAPSVGDLRACLAHRLAACGRGDALDGQVLDRAAARSSGFGEALAWARSELDRAVLLGAERARPAPRRGSDLFDPQAVREVAALLDALSPAAEQPQ